MTLTSDEEFAESIADVVELVARGDIAAFEIPGQTTVEPIGQRRFQQTYEQLATAARATQRKVILRWVFDPPGTGLRTSKHAEVNAKTCLGRVCIAATVVPGHDPLVSP
jgi:hypothetical protein